MRIELERLARPGERMIIEPAGADERESEIGLGVAWLAHQRLAKQIRRLAIVEALVQEPAPAHPIARVAVRLAHGCAKFLVRRLVAPETPVAFCPQVGAR